MIMSCIRCEMRFFRWKSFSRRNVVCHTHFWRWCDVWEAFNTQRVSLNEALRYQEAKRISPFLAHNLVRFIHRKLIYETFNHVVTEKELLRAHNTNTNSHSDPDTFLRDAVVNEELRRQLMTVFCIKEGATWHFASDVDSTSCRVDKRKFRKKGIKSKCKKASFEIDGKND